jgi:predicted amidophosphoribosyltransferase
LLRQFRQADPQLKTPMASLMAMQVLQENRPLPDVIVPLPSARLTKLKQGFDGIHLLASELAEIIDRPVIRALARALVPQEGTPFCLKKGARICDLRVMLVVDRFEQQEASQAAHELSKGFPLEIDVIGFL